MSIPLLEDLLAPYVAPAQIALAPLTPANLAKAAKSEHSRGLVGDSTPCEGLRISAKAVPRAAGAEPDSQLFAALRKPLDGPRPQQTCGFSQDSQLSQGCLPTNATAEALAAVTWTDGDIESFLARRARLMRWGWTEAAAETMAERLVLRDREGGDDRRTCIECKHFRGRLCREPKRAGVGGPEVGALALVLQRCPAFTST